MNFFQLPLNYKISFLGILWTLFTMYNLYKGKNSIYSKKYSVYLFFILLLVSLKFVLSEIKSIENLANGLKILDTRYPYFSKDIIEFGTALGESGRIQYAAFQLGYDTLAPPAFASFIASIACNILPENKLKFPLLFIWIYLISVLLANTLMPVVMLSFTEKNSFQIELLYILVPLLDFAKYSFHLIAWISILYLKFKK